MLQIGQLQNNFNPTGTLKWIGIRPARRSNMLVLNEASVEPGIGIIGDRFKGTSKSKRQVSLVQAEHLEVIAKLVNLDRVAPEMLRRNLVVAGINLLALKGQQFKIGDALLEYSGLCHPCSRMEEMFGKGGYNATRGHAGILARVIKSGRFTLGDEVSVEPPLQKCDEIK